MKDRLKHLRNEQGLKQREFAAKVGVSVGTVGQWEAGIAPPGDARISKICSVFGVREEWLRNGSGDMYDPEKSDEEQYKGAFVALFNALPPKFQKIFKEIAKEKWGVETDEEEPAAPTKETPAPSSDSRSVNISVNGDRNAVLTRACARTR